MNERRLAHFEVLERIGQGGMGVVFKARDTHLGRTAAIKVLPPGVSSDPERRSRFLREAQAAANLNHPNIATVYQFGPALVDDPELAGPHGPREVLFLAMEMVEGEDLQARLQRGPLSPKEAFDLGVQIAEGLATAHRAGVVHRDLKPNNIRITPDGRVKLLDFGLAKVREGRLSPTPEEVGNAGFKTSQGMLLGTPPYMAPEQLRGAEVDERSDLYALGVVLYQMIAGRPPYPADNLLEYVKALSADRPPPLASLGAAVSEAQEAVITKLLQHAPEKRYVSAEEAAKDLRALGGLAPNTPVTLRRPLPELPRLERRTARIALLALGLIAAGLLAVFLLRRPAADRSTIAVLSLVAPTPDQRMSRHGELITELIYDHLSAIADLNVIGPTEADAYRSRGISSLGRELAAATVLEGNVRSSGGHAILTTRILDSESATPIWRQVYSEPNVEGLYRSSEKIAGDVRLVLTVWQQVGRKIRAADLSHEGSESLGQLDRSSDSALAIRYFTLALEVNDSLVPAFAGRSLAYQQEFYNSKDRRWLELAMTDARTAVEQDPRDPMARIALGRSLRIAGDLDEAEENLETSILLDPALDLALLELAVVHQQQGRLDKAAEVIRKAVELRPDYWDYWNQLGVILWRQGDFDGARHAFDTAQELAPTNVTWPLANLVGLSVGQGNYHESLALVQGLPMHLLETELATNIGTAYYFTNQFQEAERFHREATLLDPNHPAFRRNLGDTLQALGRESEALAEFTKAADLLEAFIQGNPSLPHGTARLSLYLAKAQNCSASIELAEQEENRAKDDLVIAQSLAEAYFLCGRNEKGGAMLDHAIRLGLPRTPAEQLRSIQYRKIAGRTEGNSAP